MKRIILLLGFILLAGASAMAQIVETEAIDRKGTRVTVIDATTKVLTHADSTVLYVTATQLKDSAWVKAARNGLTETDQVVELGGALIKDTEIITTAEHFLQISGLQAGDNTNNVMVVDANNNVKVISAADLFNALTFSNGLTKTGNDVKLGGDLTQATTITTGTNELTIATDGGKLNVTGLAAGDLDTDELVVADANGTLKKVQASALLQSGEKQFETTAGQAQYNDITGMPADATRVWVYRNGAKLLKDVDFTVTAETVTFTGTMAGLVVAEDIVEVQWVK